MTKEELREAVEKSLKQVMELIENNEWKHSNPEHKALWDEMVSNANKLHKKVKPKHHAYMIKNRGVSPDDPEFYDHIHPIQDLLKFMHDPHANDDPEDVTIGHEFEFEVYTRRWGHNDRYTIRRTSSGWTVNNLAIGGPCNKKGAPYLYKNFDQDSINYPEEMPGYMECLVLK